MIQCSICNHNLNSFDKYCKYCGAPLSEDVPIKYNASDIAQKNTKQKKDNSSLDMSKPVLKAIAFFIPIAGLLLYFYYKRESIVTAKKYLKMVIINFVLSIVVLFLSMVLQITLFAVLKPIPQFTEKSPIEITGIFNSSERGNDYVDVS